MGSLLCAIEDGVEYDSSGSRVIYYPKCELCGRKLRRTGYSRKRTYICDYCKGMIKAKEKVLVPNAKTPHEIRFDKAVERIKATVSDFEKYGNAIRIAKTRCEQYDSIPEAMVAIELLKLHYKIIPQQRIRNYRVDFALPDEKIIIEVDGKLYHRANKEKDKEREARIQFAVGLDWKIIRIPADLIAKDISKLSSCIAIYK